MWIPKHKRITLNEAFADLNPNGAIFVHLTNPPWGDDIDLELLDIDYVINHSGDKLISPIVHGFIGLDELVTQTGRYRLARLVEAKFYPIWTKLWETYDIEYDPLKNYSMTETATTAETGTDSNTITYGGTQDRTINRTGSVDDSRYGFNSVTAVPVDGSSSTESTLDGVVNGGSDTSRGTDTKNISYTRSRNGFNGLSSYQELINKDRALWVTDYFSKVYHDLDLLLTLPVYPADAVLNNPYWIPSYPII